MSQLAVELPTTLASAVKRLAAESKVSINDFIAQTLAQRIELEEFRKRYVDRAARADLDAALAVLALAPDIDPMPGDELPEDLRRRFKAEFDEPAGALATKRASKVARR